MKTFKQLISEIKLSPAGDGLGGKFSKTVSKNIKDSSIKDLNSDQGAQLKRTLDDILKDKKVLVDVFVLTKKGEISLSIGTYENASASKDVDKAFKLIQKNLKSALESISSASPKQIVAGVNFFKRQILHLKNIKKDEYGDYLLPELEKSFKKIRDHVGLTKGDFYEFLLNVKPKDFKKELEVSKDDPNWKKFFQQMR